jgi:uncharacterized protein YdiU (UPF0061 family)
LEHSYAELPALFYRETLPARAPRSELVVLNHALAISLGLDPVVLERSENAGFFTGTLLPDGASPLAQAYAGHQFGHFTGLGDGRAILLGEQIAPGGTRFDIHLKGSGRTPFSRGGDGLAALGPMLREYLISEAMHALGIPTTRSLAVAVTGETVFRSDELPGAVLTRVAASHIRVGTFQWAAAHEDVAALEAIADHTRRRHFPEIADGKARHVDFFRAVMERQAALIAKWLHVGFIHGVMNTDNMALSGETIDYGPCAFMDVYDPATVFSSIDRNGRYAYGKQPEIARWNLARLAEAMLPLFHADQKQAVDMAKEVLTTFEPVFQSHWLAGMRAKLGLTTDEPGDADLAQALLDWMENQRMDFTNTFHALGDEAAVMDPPFQDAEFAQWHEAWQQRLSRQTESPAKKMRTTNPAVIPRNHMVEEALTAASEEGDMEKFHALLDAVTRPFAASLDKNFMRPAPDGSPPYQTFCGT